jgi:hypothetical protein
LLPLWCRTKTKGFPLVERGQFDATKRRSLVHVQSKTKRFRWDFAATALHLPTGVLWLLLLGMIPIAPMAAAQIDPEPLSSTATIPLASDRLPRQRQRTLQYDAIMKALALLPDAIQDSMPRVRVLTDQFRVRNVAEGVTYPGVDDNIYISAASDTYVKAEKGDNNAVKKLASLIVHERYHLQNGLDEGPAYDEQLAILRALQAPAAMIAGVEEARASATDNLGKKPYKRQPTRAL